MTKRIQLSVLLLLFLIPAFSQIGIPDDRANGSVTLSSSIFFEEVFGKPFNPAGNVDINGTPFLNDEWKKSVIRLKDGRVFESVPVRLNLYTGDVHYFSLSDKELVAPEGIITGLIMKDTAANGVISDRRVVRLLPVGTDTKNPWYEIAENGKASLLLHTTVKISEIKTLGSPVANKEFLHIDDAFILLDERLIKCKKDKSFFPGIMTDKKDEVQQYIDSHNLKFKSAEDFKEIIRYYNSLENKGSGLKI